MIIIINNYEIKALSDLVDVIKVQEIFDIMHDGIMIVNNDYKILYYNNAMEKIEGLKAGEVVGKFLLDIFPFQTYEKNTLMQAVKDDKRVTDFIQSYITYKGKKITVITSSLPIKIDNSIVGGIEITKDLSILKSLNEKVIDLQNEINKNNVKTKKLNGRIDGCHYCFDDIIGESDAIQKTVKYAKKVVLTNSTVLINGETGTGKEMFVQSIHNNSIRRNNPFVAINCAALPGELLEGILFGTAKGGFTGSIDRPGLFEQANGGTLLLDEINSMDRVLQAKLLRVLQEGYIRRVGATEDIEIDVRLISTTNCSLMDSIDKGTFREDLYYRLSVVNINVPPLRERDEDIMLLADHFIKLYNNLLLKNVEGLSPEAMELFKRYDWPGNIRELKHCIEGIMNIIDERKFISFDMLPINIRNNVNAKTKTPQVYTKSSDTLNDMINSTEEELIMKAISESKGNISKAADLLGIKRQALQYRMKKHGISKDNYNIKWN